MIDQMRREASGWSRFFLLTVLLVNVGVLLLLLFLLLSVVVVVPILKARALGRPLFTCEFESLQPLLYIYIYTIKWPPYC